MSEAERVDAYLARLDTIKRLEPEIASIDASAAYASIAISLKRLADTAQRIESELRRLNDTVHDIAAAAE